MMTSDKKKLDVFLGRRGRGFFNLPGNVFWRNMVESNYDQFDNAANTQEKLGIGARIVSDIQRDPTNPHVVRARFLKWDKERNWYVVAPNPEAIEKTVACFDNMRNRKKKAIEKALAAANPAPPDIIAENNASTDDALKQIANLVKDHVSKIDGHHDGNKVQKIVTDTLATIGKLVISELKLPSSTPGQHKPGASDIGDLAAVLAGLTQEDDDLDHDDALYAIFAEDPNNGLGEPRVGQKRSFAQIDYDYDAEQSRMSTVVNGLSPELESKLGELEFVNFKDIDGKGEFTGTVWEGRPHGVGYKFYKDGKIRCGVWNNGNLHGQGLVLEKNGNRCFGQFFNHKKEGEAVYVYKDKSKYVGTYVEDQKHGMGIFTDAKGNIYDGQFHEGYFHGQGTLIYANGNKVVGTFEKWNIKDKCKTASK